MFRWLPVVSQGRMDFLREDLAHLFDEQGIDKTAYENKVEFRDPITSYNSVSGQNQVALIHTCDTCTFIFAVSCHQVTVNLAHIVSCIICASCKAETSPSWQCTITTA